MDPNQHVYAFRNAPLAAKPGWARHLLAEVEARLAQGGYSSADAYYSDKQSARTFAAALVGKTAHQYDPMGYWFDMPSN